MTIQSERSELGTDTMKYFDKMKCHKQATVGGHVWGSGPWRGHTFLF
jgi:hypothetical protein